MKPGDKDSSGYTMVEAARRAIDIANKVEDDRPVLSERERWRNYSPSILGHMGQGAAAAVAVVYAYWFWPLAVLGCLILATNMAYQIFGYIRKKDSLRRDWRDYMVGFSIAVVPSVAHVLLFIRP